MERIVRLVILTILAISSPSAYGQDEPFYFADERKKQPLVSSARSAAVLIEKGQIAAFKKIVADTPAIRALDLPLLERYDIVVLQAESVPSAPPLDGSLRRFLSLDDVTDMVVDRVPVFADGGIELLLTNRFAIAYKDEGDPPPRLVDELNDRLGPHLRMFDTVLQVDRIELELRRAIAEPAAEPDRTNQFIAALSKINELNDDPDIRFAVPLFIRVYPPRLPRASRTVGTGAGTPSACIVQAPGEAVNDPYFGNQWALANTGTNSTWTEDNNPPGQAGADINVVPAWGETLGTDEIIIAVIDLGVELCHPDLAPRLVSPGIDVTVEDGTDVTDGDPNPQRSQDWHGTAVAGIAAATTDNSAGVAGVDRKARILPVRVGEGGGDGFWNTLDGGEATAILEAVNKGAHVLINAWSHGYSEDPLIRGAIEDAVNSGRVVIISAGNHEPEECETHPVTERPVNCQESREVTFPASLAETSSSEAVRESLIVVSATNNYDEFKTHLGENVPVDGQTPALDNGAPSQDRDHEWGSNRGPAVTVSAPGSRDIYTTVNGRTYGCFWGTSASAPFVGGAAALLLSLYPEATPAQIRGWLEAGADPGATQATDADGRPIRDDFYGHGRLNVAASLQEAKCDNAWLPRRFNIRCLVREPLFNPEIGE
jgi:subtilisin family serine protease